MEYVESKLASHHATSAESQQSPLHPGDAHATSAGPAETQKPTVQGKLMEVDLGDEARSRNVALTERARRRLEGDASREEDIAGRGWVPKRARPARGRNRRGSDDARRDQLVEKFLHENRRMFSPLPPSYESSRMLTLLKPTSTSP